MAAPDPTPPADPALLGVRCRGFPRNVPPPASIWRDSALRIRRPRAWDVLRPRRTGRENESSSDPCTSFCFFFPGFFPRSIIWVCFST